MGMPFRHLQNASDSLFHSTHHPPTTPSTQSSHLPPPDLPFRRRHPSPHPPTGTSYTPGPSPDQPCPANPTMFQAFEWNVPKDQQHWARLSTVIPSLKAIGLDAMWIPPGCKGGWHGSNGYDIYDPYDLGEFEQKDSRATKWGTREQLERMMKVARMEGVGVYWDAVLNHRAAADFSETCYAVKVDPEDRTKELGKPIEIEAWTGFDFTGRKGRYSSMKYRWQHFTGTDYDHRTKSNGVYKFLGRGKKDWAQDVDGELGNYDYLMFADVDYTSPEVRADVFAWGEWLGRSLSLSGIRFDAIKHFSEDFLRDFIRHLDRTVGKDWFLVGEYWREDLDVLTGYIERMGHRISLFDVGLVGNLARLSNERRPDLRTVWKGTLAGYCPRNAVTFVQNHDTQERGSLETIVQPSFIPHAYALILLRLSPAYPCVFYGDLYGILGPRPRPPACGGKLPHMVLARKLWAYGGMNEYCEKSDVIGWTRLGHPSHSRGAGLAVVLNASYASFDMKRMNVGPHHAGERWTDILGWAWGEVVIDADGWGWFPVGPRSVGVWVDREAEGRARLGVCGGFDDDIYKHEDSVGSASIGP